MRGLGTDAAELKGIVNKNEIETEDNLIALTDRSDHSVFDQNMVARLMVGKYKTEFCNVSLLKDAISLHLYTVLLQKLKPATIIDLGTAFGGSSMWFAHQSPEAKVITIDIEDMRHSNCKQFPNIEFVQGDIENCEHLNELLSNSQHPWLICEDCHLPAQTIMNVFDKMMTPGDYIVFEDTHNANPDKPGMSAESDYECNGWSQEKYDKVKTCMLKYQDYKIDADVQDFYGYNGCTHINSIFKKRPDV